MISTSEYQLCANLSVQDYAATKERKTKYYRVHILRHLLHMWFAAETFNFHEINNRNWLCLYLKYVEAGDKDTSGLRNKKLIDG